MAYPADKKTFTTIGTANLMDEAGYSHRTRHNDIQTLAESIEDVLGTTAGTSVLMNFADGDFAVENDGGTLDNAVIGTPAITGGTADSFLLNDPRIEQINDNDGDAWLKFSSVVGTPVNYVQVANSITANPPSIVVEGTDTNIDLDIRVKGTGKLEITDDSDKEILSLQAVASAVNEITVTPAITTNSPAISATGDDTNIDLELTPKGTGTLTVGGNTVQTGAWKTWTPAFSGFTGTTSLTYAKYCQIGKTIHYRAKFIGEANGEITFTLPAAEHADYQLISITGMGHARIKDVGVTIFSGAVVYDAPGVVVVYVNKADATYVTSFTGLTGSVPMTWTASDELYVWGTYEAA